MKVIITVDTEADNEWSDGPSASCHNVRWIPRFQELCERHEFRPTYLITYQIAEDETAVRLFTSYLERGACEVGAHLHPWSTPPASGEEEASEAFCRPFPTEYSESVLREMCANLTQVIESNLGVRPISYRAGRCGLDEMGARILLELGYDVDCSVTPGVSWKATMGRPEGNGGPDFRDAPVFPYFMSPSAVTQPGGSTLLEVPVTILFTRWPFESDGLVTRLWSKCTKNELLNKVARKMGYDRKWFRPFPEYSAADLVSVYHVAENRGLPVIQMMLHSSELMPGGSPYRPDERAVEQLYCDLGEVFTVMSDHGSEGVTLGDFAKEMRPAT